MSVTPHCFLALSKAAVLDKDEISKRNSLSRAYYAAFHLVRQHFPPSQNSDEVSAGMHRTYIDYLMQFPSESMQRKIGIYLQTLHSRRIKADYKIERDIPVGDPAMQLHVVDTIFALLESTNIAQASEDELTS